MKNKRTKGCTRTFLVATYPQVEGEPDIIWGAAYVRTLEPQKLDV